MIIEDCSFIGPGIMTNHTKHVSHMRPNIPKEQLITRIGYGSIIGSCCSMTAGITIGDNVILGANCGVYKSLLESGVYMGNPAKKTQELPEGYYLERPADYAEHSFPVELLSKYLPHCRT